LWKKKVGTNRGGGGNYPPKKAKISIRGEGKNIGGPGGGGSLWEKS